MVPGSGWDQLGLIRVRLGWMSLRGSDGASGHNWKGCAYRGGGTRSRRVEPGTVGWDQVGSSGLGLMLKDNRPFCGERLCPGGTVK